MFISHTSTVRKQKGFTLVELLIVIVILGLLTTIGLGSFMSSQRKGRDARRKADLDSITSALEMYYNDYNQYPVNDSSAEIDGCDSGGCGWNQVWEKNGAIYMVQIPEDPAGGSYAYQSDGSSYVLYARFENTQDSDIPAGPSGPGIYNTLGFDCLSGGCNYEVHSSNMSSSSLPTVLDDPDL